MFTVCLDTEYRNRFMMKMAVIDFLIMRQLEIRDPWKGGGGVINYS